MAGENPLFDHIYEPPQQPFPETAAGLAALIGATPFAIFPGTEGSGTTITDAVAGKVLTLASPISGLYTPQWGTANGFYNGTDMHNRPCPTFHESSDAVATITDALFDHDASTSIGGLTVFRISRATFGQRVLLGWAGGLGLTLEVHYASGFTRLVYNSLTTSTLTNAAVGDFGWHCIVWRWNKTTGRIQFWTDYGNGTDVALAGAAITGGLFGYGDVKAASNCLGFCPAYTAIFKGAQAEALGAATVTSFWRHGDIPANMSYSRNSGINVPDTTDTSFGERFIPWGTGQVAYGAHPDLDESPGKTGILTIGAKANLLVNPLDFGGGGAWVQSNFNRVNGRYGEAPCGAWISNRVSATAANGFCYQQVTTVANTQYTFSIPLKSYAPQGTPTSGFIRLHNGSSVIASTAFTTTDTWKRWSVTGQHAGTTTRVIVEITTNAEQMEAGHAQLETGWMSPPIGAYNTTKTRANDTWWHPVTGLDILHDDKGSILAQVVGVYDEDPLGTTHQILTSRGPLGFNNRYVLRYGASSNDNIYIVRNDAGVDQEATTTPWHTTVNGTPYLMHLRWDSTATLKGYASYTDYWIDQAARYVDGGPDTDGWTVAADPTNRISPGHDYGGGGAEFGGMISRLVIYAKPQAGSKRMP